MKIKLHGGHFAIIDKMDFNKISDFKWSLADRGRHKYASAKMTVEGKRKNILLHRFLLNPKNHIEIDHVNGNGLDNRRCNLRFCTKSQNAANRTKTRGKSMYKGVNFVNGKWQANITINQKIKCLGTFNTQEEAAMAYNKSALKYFGDFARPNIIPKRKPKPSRMVKVKMWCHVHPNTLISTFPWKTGLHKIPCFILMDRKYMEVKK